MGLFDSLFSQPGRAPAAKLPATAAAPFEFKIPPALPKLQRTIGDPPVDAAAQLSQLLKEQKAPEAIDLLAAQLPERDAIRWARESCEAVADKLTPADKVALECCKSWLADSSPLQKDLAAAAAAKAGYGGPGAWAAQAVAWSQPTEPASPPVIQTGPLFAKAVAGSIMLAAALSKSENGLPSFEKATVVETGQFPRASALGATDATPAATDATPAAELLRMYKPFIDNGIAIAAGK